MPRTAQVFISHRHRYDGDYHNLKGRLEMWGILHRDATWYAGRHPERLSERETAERLQRAISWCNVFIVVARMASHHNEWCRWEVATADEMGKPILAFRPTGTTVVPRFIQDATNYYDSFTHVDRLERLLAEILE